jgi:predicted transcriptional regulator
MNDVEISTAKKLAQNLYEAGVIEKLSADRIIESLTPKLPEEAPKN